MTYQASFFEGLGSVLPVAPVFFWQQMVKPVQLSLGEDEIKALAGYHEDNELRIENMKRIVNWLDCNLIYAIITNGILLTISNKQHPKYMIPINTSS